MRVLFTTVPAFGHFNPIVPLATAAVERGDEVLVATGADLCEWVSSCGLPVVQAGHGGTRSPDEEEVARRWGKMRIFHFFTTMTAPPMIRDVLELAGDWKPDLIVHDEGEYAAPLVAELLGIPCVTHSFAAPARPNDERAVFAELLEPIWAEYTASPPRLSGDVYLDACPPAFQTEAIGSIPGVRPIRPIPFDGPKVNAPEWIETLRHPAAYLTLGTVAVFARVEVLQPMIEAVAHAANSVVVTTGPNPPTAFKIPGSVLAEQYLQQSVILAAVDVVVSHGGAGTTLGAIEYGLPHVVVPQQTMSQLRNAEQIAALGIGVHVPPGSDASRLQSAVHHVLNDPAYASQAAVMREALHALPTPEAVLEDVTSQLV